MFGAKERNSKRNNPVVKKYFLVVNHKTIKVESNCQKQNN